MSICRLIIGQWVWWYHGCCIRDACLSDKPTHQTRVQGRGQVKKEYLGLICLGVIVKADISWVPVSSCSYTNSKSPLTFKLTVKSIILSSFLHQLLSPFGDVEVFLVHWHFTRVYTALSYISIVLMISVYCFFFLHTIFSFI